MEEVRATTTKLRTSPDPYWVRIRYLLRARGLDLARAAVANWYPDDVRQDVGCIATADGHVWYVEYDYVRSADDRGDFVKFEDLSENWREEALFPDEVEVALHVAQENG
jgi:hypothetical protein